MYDEEVSRAYLVIGKNISKARGGMHKSELAKKAGVSRQTLAAIEEGKPISLENLIKIAKALEIHPSDLFISDKDTKQISYMHKLFMEKLLGSFSIDIDKLN